MILDVAQRRADLTPDRPALWWDGRWLDYAELNRRAAHAAAYLVSRGITKGDRVAILAHNHVAHIDLILATAKLGFVYAPLNVRLSAKEQAAIGTYLKPTLVLHDEDHREAAEFAANAAAAPMLNVDDYETALESPVAASTVLDPDLGPDDVQMILLTGGTTGVPKGAMLPYRQGFYNAVNTVLSWGLRDDDVVIQATPCYHAAVNALTVPLLHLGARVVLQHAFDAREYLELVQQQGVTALFLVPTMYRMLAEHPDFQRADLSGVRWAISGGAPCPEPVRATFAARGVRFRQGYGLTEAGVNCFAITLDQAERKPASVGKPMLHAAAAVRRADASLCDVGEVGELTLKGPHVFLGYFDRPDATDEALRGDWLWTGDLATVDEEGFFTIVGRRKEMFISGGENVFPIEIETALYDHPAVAECAVLGVPDERWGEVGLAVVVLRPDASIDQNALVAFLRERVARYKVPKHLILTTDLPKSGAGKILKSVLLERFLAQDRAEGSG
ncbi:MAG: AMP-binding protein [Trueperaceae bacterium]